MTARESLANRKPRVRLRAAALFLMAVVGITYALATAGAQQEGGRQRPRRVGDAPQNTQPQPTPRPTAPGEEVGEGDVVRVETQLVSVPTVVTDSAGRPIAGLRAENFRLFENNQPQAISNFATTDAPFEVALLLDTSGSTRADVALIRRAANLFIDSLRPGDRVSIISFNTVREDRETLATVEIKTPLTSEREGCAEPWRQ